MTGRMSVWALGGALLAGAIIMEGRVLAQSKPATTVQVALKVGGVSLTSNGPGECIHSTESSLYDVPGTQWGARRSEGGQRVNFTMWRLQKGNDGATLFITVAGKTHRVNTVPVGPPGNRVGSGTVTFEARGAGGVFTLDLRADTGAAITGQLTCSGFTKPEDNGDAGSEVLGFVLPPYPSCLRGFFAQRFGQSPASARQPSTSRMIWL